MARWRHNFAITTLFVLSLILNHSSSGADNSVEQTKIDSLFAAAKSNDVHAAKTLIAEGAPIDSKDGSGRTALLVATYHNAIDVARLLIDAGANVNSKDSLQDSPYLYAGAEGKLKILKMTVDAGAELSATNRYGGTALIPAAHHGHVEVVRYLLTTKTNIDHVNNLGWTALLEAVILGDGSPTYQKIVQLLVNAGADRSIADNDGITPLDHAKASGQNEVVRILEGLVNQ